MAACVMTNCQYEQQIEAYHDNALDADQRASVEAHVAGCASCATHLNQLQAMSQLFATSARPHLSQISRHRLRRHVDAAMEQGLLRFAWAMSGIAASILLAGSAWLMHADNITQAASPDDAP